MLRNVMELLVTDNPVDAFTVLHYTGWYFMVFFSVLFIICSVTEEFSFRNFNVTVNAMYILLIAPVIDLIYYRSGNVSLTYFLEKNQPEILWRFFTFFGEMKNSGVTAGIRAEVGIVLITCMWYFWKKYDFFRSIRISFYLYSAIFISGSLPIAVKCFCDSAGLTYRSSNSLYASICIQIATFAAGLCYAGFVPGNFRIIFKDLRFSRILHYFSMVFLGLILGYKYGFCFTDIDNFVKLTALFSGLLMLIIFATIENNLADVKIDFVSNPDRPMFNKNLNVENYLVSRWYFLISGFLLSACAGFSAMMCNLTVTFNYHLYSMPPYRIKRLPVVSKMVISVNSLISVVCGYLLFNSDLSGFPAAITAVFLFPGTIAASLIDLKDIQGDKSGNILTLPHLVGVFKAKIIIAIAYVSTIIFLYKVLFADDLKTIVFLLPVLLLQFMLITSKDFKEFPVMICHLSILCLTVIYLFHSCVKSHDNEYKKISESLLKSIQFLCQNQDSDGYFPSGYSRVYDMKKTTVSPVSPFFTSFIMYSIGFIEFPQKNRVLSKAAFSLAEENSDSRWRFFSKKSGRKIDWDIDDTCCNGWILKRAGINFSNIPKWIDHCKTETGLYKTWIRETDEVNDVDCSVNANVLLYLGDSPDGNKLLKILEKILNKGDVEKFNFYYQREVYFYYLLSRAIFENRFPDCDELKDKLRMKVTEKLNSDSEIDHLQKSLAILTLFNIESGDIEFSGKLVGEIIKDQGFNGSWKEVYFCAGSTPVARPDWFWGSEAHTTAACMEAIARYAALKYPEMKGVYSVPHFPDLSYMVK